MRKNDSGKTGHGFLSSAPTPPLGWNSYDCFGGSVTEAQTRENADYMVKHLVRYGWQYIVLDIQWFGPEPLCLDEWGRFWPTVSRFPSSANGKGFAPLADYVHAKGLKFGVHVLRGIPRVAVARNTPILGAASRAADIADTVRPTMSEDTWGIDMTRPGAQEYYDSVFALLAEWKVDFVKVDDLSYPYHQAEIEAVRAALDRCGRSIVFSTSPGRTPVDKGPHVGRHANMWRISTDLWDNWQQLEDEFDLLHRWTPYRGPGNWPDADMLPLGSLREGQPNPWTKFTRDEQYTLITLWCIARSPLMMGGNLPKNDAFTLSLLTNADVLAVNQDSANNRQLYRRDNAVAWTADVPGAPDKYVALFNLADPLEIDARLALFESDLITRETPGQAVDIDVDITAAERLYLVVDMGPDDSDFDHVNWVEPRLVGRGGERRLTELDWLQATSGWGSVLKGKSVSGGELVIDGTRYAYGIGTHSTSIIEYALPAGYTRFRARAGLDPYGIKNSPTGATVRFLVCTQAAVKPNPGAEVRVDLAGLGLRDKCRVSDLWRGRALGGFEGEFAAFLPPHGAGLYRVGMAASGM